MRYIPNVFWSSVILTGNQTILLADALDAPRPPICHPFLFNKKAAPKDGLARVAGSYRFLLYQGVLVCAFVLVPALFILPQTPDSLNHFLLIRSEA